MRFWDIRQSARMAAAAGGGGMLPSDSTLRPDRNLLAQADYKAAQVACACVCVRVRACVCVVEYIMNIMYICIMKMAGDFGGDIYV